MAKQRTPTEILRLKGAFRKNPARLRARENEPAPAGEIGAAPAHLAPDAALCWGEIVTAAPPGLLCRADRLIVEHAARILAAVRRDGAFVNRALQTRLMACFGKLGLTPADRARFR
jgi:hypothetical protein